MDMFSPIHPYHQTSLYAQQPPVNPAKQRSLFFCCTLLDTDSFFQLAFGKKYTPLFQLQHRFYFYRRTGPAIFKTGVQSQFLHPHFCRHVLYYGCIYTILIVYFKEAESHTHLDGKNLCAGGIGFRSTYRPVHEFFCKRKFLGKRPVFIYGYLLVLQHYKRPTDDKT